MSELCVDCTQNKHGLCSIFCGCDCKKAHTSEAAAPKEIKQSSFDDKLKAALEDGHIIDKRIGAAQIMLCCPPAIRSINPLRNRKP